MIAQFKLQCPKLTKTIEEKPEIILEKVKQFNPELAEQLKPLLEIFKNGNTPPAM